MKYKLYVEPRGRHLSPRVAAQLRQERIFDWVVGGLAFIMLIAGSTLMAFGPR